jgi:hypothetical protein
MPILLMHKKFTIWKRDYKINYFDEYINEGFHYIFMTVFLLVDYEVELDDDENYFTVFTNFDFEKLKVLT